MVVTAAKILFVIKLAMPYLFSVPSIQITSHSLLILMVNILVFFFSNIDSCYLGIINEDFNFEYGVGTVAKKGCGATLHNVFWYFGGAKPFGYQRQVKLQKHLFHIHMFYFRLVKLLDAS